MNKINIIADDKIPFLKGELDTVANISYLPASEINNQTVKNADALIIRTRTNCDAKLLKGTNVNYIGTATIGTDHIDSKYCADNRITWNNVPGCNATSVGQYILSALFVLSLKKGLMLRNKTIGIVGVGNVGKAVERYASIIGLRVLRNDPFRAENESEVSFSSLETIASECDIITFHTPLTFECKYPTYHLVDEAFFKSLKKNPVIINTSRGEVINELALISAFDQMLVSDLIIDCWEHEPDINSELTKRTFISTPHIAGYSADGKSKATSETIKYLSDFFNLKLPHSQSGVPQAAYEMIDLNKYSDNRVAHTLLHTYNILEDSDALKGNPDQFEFLRGNYPLRREYLAYYIEGGTESERKVLKKLGFQMI